MKISRTTRLKSHVVSELSDRMADWPESWAGMQADVAFGQGLVEEMRPFIIHLHEQGLTRKTLRRHLNNLWCIGGEIIRDLNDNDNLRKTKPAQLLLKSVALEKAPLIHYLDETEQRTCDATARKLLRFLASKP